MPRLANYLMNLGLVAVLLASPLALALPPQAEADLLQQEVGAAMREGQFKGLQEKFQRIADLKAKVPESFEFHWGRVSYENGDFVNAMRHLDRYISAQGRAGKYYDDALALYAKSRPLAGEQQRAFAEREAQEKLQAREEEMYRNLPVPPRGDEGSLAEVWGALESSPAYLRYANLVKRRPIAYSYDFLREPTYGEKYSHKATELFRPGDFGVDLFIDIADDFRRYDGQVKKWGDASLYRWEYACLFGCLIMVDVSRLDKSPKYMMRDLVIKGSLFPLRVGQSMSVSYKVAEYFEDPKRAPHVSSYANGYEIVGRIPASKLNAALAGDAWIVNSGDKIAGYFLGDVGVYRDSTSGIFKAGLNDYTTEDSVVGKRTYSNRRIKAGD